MAGPNSLKRDEIVDKISKLPGVKEVSSLQVWVLKTGDNVATVSIIAKRGADRNRMQDEIETMLRASAQSKKNTI